MAKRARKKGAASVLVPNIRSMSQIERAHEVGQMIGGRIRDQRKARRITLENLAKKTGFTRGYLSKIENSRKVPPIGSLARIAQALDLEIGLFFQPATGLLKGKTVTTRRYAPPGVPTPLSTMRELFPDLNPVEAQVIDNGAIITGGGVMLSADTTLHLIEKYFGEKLAWDVAHLIEYKTAWQANRAEFSTEGRRELARPGHS
jgi:transcriptional regulator with XRE-family HTH domain